MSEITDYYGKAYADWQLKDNAASHAASVNLWMFKPYIHDGAVLLDFGCAAGHMLDLFPTAQTYGIEVNPFTRKIAQTKGHIVEARMEDLDFPEDSVDVIISSHCLEHTGAPYNILIWMRHILRLGGKLVLLVPCERHDRRWQPDNWDKHLYTWSPLNLGNLVTAAGFEVESCKRILHQHPPYRLIKPIRALGPDVFQIACRLTGFLRRSVTQVHLVGTKVQ